MMLRPVTYQLKAKDLDLFLAGNNDKLIKNISQLDYSVASVQQQSGFIAQEVETAAQSAGYSFSGLKKPAHDKDNYSLAYAQFVVPLVKGMQEQQQLIDNLNNQNKQLKQSLADLKLEMEQLRKLIVK